MDIETASTLNALTGDFYARCADSFAQTRTRPWHGWQRCVDAIGDALAKSELSVLDLGCGTLRFEDFLAERTSAHLDVYAVDSCDALLVNKHNVHFTYLDIISTLWRDNSLEDALRVPACDLTCAFGLMHHIPGTQPRNRFLDTMFNKALPDGHVIVSLWQFERDGRLVRKARTATDAALQSHPGLQLDTGDWLLDWQGEPGIWRYCHSFSHDEIDALVMHVRDRARLVDRFNADGPNDDLNCYLVFRRL